MLKQMLSLLNNAPDEIIQAHCLAEDNFTFLLNSNYQKLISDFKQRFLFKGGVPYPNIGENNIFMEPTSQIELQVLNFVVADYSVPETLAKFNSSISLHNNSQNTLPHRHPSRIMVQAINLVGNYILDENIPCLVGYYEFDFILEKPKTWKIPKGLEKYV